MSQSTLNNTKSSLQTIIDMIPFGHENAISRERLCYRTGLNDREIRRAIGELNETGSVILNRGKGYFRYDAGSDYYYLQNYLAVEQGRVRTLNRKLKRMRKAAGV